MMRRRGEQAHRLARDRRIGPREELPLGLLLRVEILFEEPARRQRRVGRGAEKNDREDERDEASHGAPFERRASINPLPLARAPSRMKASNSGTGERSSREDRSR